MAPPRPGQDVRARFGQRVVLIHYREMLEVSTESEAFLQTDRGGDGEHHGQGGEGQVSADGGQVQQPDI